MLLAFADSIHKRVVRWTPRRDETCRKPEIPNTEHRYGYKLQYKTGVLDGKIASSHDTCIYATNNLEAGEQA